MPDLNTQAVPLFMRGYAYLDNAWVVGQQCADKCRIVAGPVAGPLTPLEERGCTAITAGRGHWLAFLDGYGVFGPDGLMGAGMGLGCDIQATRGLSAPDGTLAVVLNYQRGIGLRLVHPDGTFVDYPDATPQGQVAVVDRTRALFVSSVTGRVETVGGLPVPQVVPGACFWPSVVAVGDEWWLFYHADDAVGMVLHPFTALTGYRLPRGFYPVAKALGHFTVAVAWAHGADDAAGDVRVIDCATEPRVVLAPVVVPLPDVPPDTPPEPTDPEEPPMPVPVDNAAALRIVEQERAKYGPTLTPSEQAQLLRNIATALNAAGLAGGPFGVLKKESGSNCDGISCDIICSGNDLTQRQWDVLLGNETHDPRWDEKGEGINIRECVVPTGGETPTPPDPPNPPDPDPDPPDTDRLDALERLVTRLLVEKADLANRVSALEQRPTPTPGEGFDHTRWVASGTVTIDVPFFGKQRKTVTLPIIRKP